MFNDREYTGGDGGHIPITQAEYDALPMDVKLNGTVYMITDGGSPDAQLPFVYKVNANHLSYSSSTPTTVSGLTFTVEQSGVWFIMASGNISTTSGTRYPRVGIYMNDTRLNYSAVSLPSNQQLSWSTQVIWDLNIGDVISVRIVTDGTVNMFEGQKLTAIKIA